MKRFVAMLLSAVMLLTMLPTYAVGEASSSESTLIETDTTISNALGSSEGETNYSDSTDTSKAYGTDLTVEENKLTVPVLGAVLANSSDATLSDNTETNSSDNTEAVLQNGNGRLMYLSDYTVSEMITCKVGWGTYTRDSDLDGNSISLWVNGQVKSFYKGVTAHATACLVYDLGEDHAAYYDFFKAYIGVDSDRGTNGNVKFTFSGSNDCTAWTTLYTPTAEFKGNTPAEQISINVKSYRYFKVDISSNGADTADHSVLADACFVTENYVAPTITTLKDGEADMNEAYFEAKLANKTADDILNNKDTELTVLQYTLVKACEYENLKTFLTTSADYQKRIETFNWLFKDLETLRAFMTGGLPNGGSYLSALDVLTDLYTTYKDDLNDTTALRKGEKIGMVRGELYRRMMLCMSLVCANGLSGWMARAGVANPVNRYAYFKENYVNEKMRDEIFENLGVDEMRWVLGNNISDAEIVWLNDYARAHPRGGNQTSYPILYSPHHHISYRWYNYDKDEYYAESNRELYTKKYMLTGYEKYGLVYGLNADGSKTSQRLWQVFEDGAVCGNISRTGANLAASFGVPACEVGQPGHAAFCIMNTGSNHQMIWGIDNDISGWTQSSNSRRMPADWGNQSDPTTTGWRASYVLLAQAALNDLDNYEKAEEILMLLPTAEDDTKREEICRAALKVMPFHRDAWLELVQMAVKSENAQDLAALAEELCSSPMKFYPNPFRDLMLLIFNRLNAIISAGGDTAEDARIHLARAQMLYKNALVRATQATDSDTAQPGATKTLANSLLSGNTLALASFSFDGDNAGKIVFREGFTSVRFQFSLDGGTTWTFKQLSVNDGERVMYTLTKDELDSITVSNDILIWLDGWPSSDNGKPMKDGAFVIDILAGAEVSGIEFNDHENRFIGNVYGMEYSLDNGTSWTVLTNDTLFEDVKTILVHKKANGTTLMGKNTSYKSTADNTTDRVYIPISRLSIAAFSSQQESQNDYAKYTIDGLYATRWHTAWNGSDQQKFIVIKTDKPTYFSGFDYTPSVGNGTVYAGQVLVSLDGENWITAATFSNWANNTDVKSLTFSSPVYGQYVKFVTTNSMGGYVSARALELFENKTIENKTIAGVVLSANPAKLSYVCGESLDLAGASAQIKFTDNTSTTLPISMLTPNKTVLNEVGEQEITLSYGSFVTPAFTVTVAERTFTPTSIAIVTLPDRLSYYAGDTVSGDGMRVTATDGTTTVFLRADEYTLSANLANTGDATVTVTMNGTSLSADYAVTVKKAIQSLKVTANPTKLVYELGDTLDTAGLVVTAVYADNTEAVLSAEEYLLENAESFSEEEGSYDIPVLLADKPSIETSFNVTVYPYFTKDGIRYSATKEHTCSVTSITSENTFVSIPAAVRFGSTVYTVVDVAEKVLAAASNVTEIALPGTLQSIADNAFTASDNLEKVYLTAHTDFAGLEIADSAFDEDVEIAVYAASAELTKKLEADLAEKPFAESLKVNNVVDEITAIEVTPPTVNTVKRNETVNLDGYAVHAILKNGQQVPLDNSACTLSEINTATAGHYPVTVTLNSNEQIAGSFQIIVMASDLKITEHPKDAFYTTSDAVVTPLCVSASSDGTSDVLLYQWYRSEDGTMNPDSDIITGATKETYTPDKKGFYYAIVSIENTEYKVFSMMAEISIGDFVAIVNKKGYESFAVAVQEASAGSTIELLKDVTLSSGITIDKNLTLNGNGHIIIRGQGYTGIMVTINGVTVHMNHITLDGGAGWYGNEHSQLLRGCQSNNVAKGTIITTKGAAKLYLGQNTVLQNNFNNYGANEKPSDNTIYGGAINAVDTSYIELNGTTIQNNYSYVFGAAIYQRGSTRLVINDCFIHGNSGGDNWNTTAICVDNTAVCIINGGTFCHNVGTEKGDVLWVAKGRLEINGGTFENNYSKNSRSIFIAQDADVVINGADKLESTIYLDRNKGITVGSGIPASGLKIETAGNLFSEQSAIVTLADGTDARALQSLITVNGNSAGLSDDGKLTVPCSSHSESEDWTIVKEATYEETGLKIKVCTQCGAQLSSEIVPLLVDVTGITLNKTEASLTVDETVTLAAAVTPDTATDKSVIWKSSDTQVVIVEDGTVTAVGAGTAAITVQTTDGNHTAACTVTVNKTVYHVTAADTQNGSVTISDPVYKANSSDGFEKGTLVAITAVPEIGYLLSTLSVKQGETELPILADHTFYMPAGDVTVTATFAKVIYHEAVEPTCVTPGNSAYWESNGKYYNDAECNNEITDKSSVVRAATGNHKADDSLSWTWINLGAGNGWTVYYTACCTDCGQHILGEGAVAIRGIVTNGEVTYSATITINNVEYTSTKTVKETYTVTLDSNIVGSSYHYGDVVTLTKDGKNYDWYVNNSLVKTASTSYAFVLMDNTVVTTQTATAVQPTLSFTASDRQDVGSGKTKIRYLVTWSLPTGYTLVAAGLMRAYNVGSTPALSKLTTNNKTSLTNRNGSYAYNLTMSAATSKKSITAVGYLTCKDASGTIKTIYSTPIYNAGV